MKQISIRNTTIGSGNVKICIPITGKTLDDIRIQAKELCGQCMDVVEWRMDHFDNVMNFDAMRKAAMILRETLPDIILLFTFRRFVEGGVYDADDTAYTALYNIVLQEELCDLLDVEYSCGSTIVNNIIKKAHEHRIYVIVSAHDFKKTAAYEDILLKMRKMEQNSADLVKMAYMPNSLDDVFVLMKATQEMVKHSNVPIITMSMDKIGMISRVFGGLYGSALTFASMHETSAPGQLPLHVMKEMLDAIHKGAVTAD